MLDKFLKEVESKLGKKNDNIIYDPKRAVEATSTGSVVLDCATGVGGLLVRGRLAEIFGLESSGKTTICLQSCVQAQRDKQIGIFIDNEQTFDTHYAQALGLVVDNKTFTVIQPMNAEETETVIDIAYKTLDRLDYIIIDSIAAMQPKAKMEAQDSTGTGMQKALHASFMSNWIPKFNAQVKRHGTAVIFTNQLRAAPSIGGAFQAKAVGDGAGIGSGFSQDTSWVTTGGHAIRFYMSQRYLLQWRKRFKEGVEDEDGDVEEEETGNLIRIRNVKNKVSVPYKDESFVIVFGRGTVDYYPVFDALNQWGYITSSGSKFTFEDEQAGITYSANGKMNFFKLFKQHDNWELAKEIYLDEMAAADEQMISNLQLGSEDKNFEEEPKPKGKNTKTSKSSKIEIED
jgi:recombination protein RecA